MTKTKTKPRQYKNNIIISLKVFSCKLCDVYPCHVVLTRNKRCFSVRRTEQLSQETGYVGHLCFEYFQVWCKWKTNKQGQVSVNSSRQVFDDVRLFLSLISDVQ